MLICSNSLSRAADCRSSGKSACCYAQADAKSADFLFDEIATRLARGPVRLGVFVQLAVPRQDSELEYAADGGPPPTLAFAMTSRGAAARDRRRALPCEVLPMELGQAFESELTKPRQERQGRIPQVSRQPQEAISASWMMSEGSIFAGTLRSSRLRPAGEVDRDAWPGWLLRNGVAPVGPFDQSISVVVGRGHGV